MSNYSDVLSEILQQGSVTNFKKLNQKFSKDELMKKFFIPRVDKQLGKQDESFVVRIVPNKEGGTPFKEVKHHYLKVNNKYEKYVCLEGLGEECPLCEAHKHYTEEGNKEEAKKYRTSVFYIVRVIQRGKESEGVKFWRFQRNLKNNGVLNKIQAIINNGADILNPYDGFDIIINCTLDDRKNSIINSVSASFNGKTPLSTNPEQIEAWINDDTVWSDVYRPKTKSDLEDVVAGRAQYWNAELKKYVRPGEEHLTGQDTVLNDSHINFENQTVDKIIGFQ